MKKEEISKVNRKTQELVNSLRDKDKIRVLFVCLGNICRSPAAQGVMEAVVERHDDSLRFEIDSAGTGNYHIGELPDSRMRVHARRRGYDLTHRARQFKSLDFDRFDIIVAMDGSNMRNVAALARTDSDMDRVVGMADFITGNPYYDHVPDPYYEGSEGFELVLDLLEDGLENLYKQLSHKS